VLCGDGGRHRGMFHGLDSVGSLLCVARGVRFGVPCRVLYFEAPFLVMFRYYAWASYVEQRNWCASATCVHEPKNWRRLKNKGTETKNHQSTMRCVFI